VIADESRNVLSLGDQLGGVELSNDALEDLVDDTGKDALVVVGSKGTVDLRQGIDARSGQDTAGNVDHLQILGTGEGGDVARLRADIVDDGSLDPGDLQVGSFGVDVALDTADAAVLDGAATTIDVEQGVVEEVDTAQTEGDDSDTTEGALGVGCRAAGSESVHLPRLSSLVLLILNHVGVELEVIAHFLPDFWACSKLFCKFFHIS
jgi:hypothetical protein